MRSFLRRPKRQVPEAAIDRPAQNINCPDFDLRVTLTSGQVFRWPEIRPGVFRGWIGPSLVEVSQNDGGLSFSGSTSCDAIRRFFSLDADLKAIACEIDQDDWIHEAIGRLRGLRLIRQDPWECLTGFILSSFNNIPRLTGMLNLLADRFGEDGRFPEPKRLAAVSERVLRNCGLGFRAPYIKQAAEMTASGRVNLEKLCALEDDALREALLSIPGVGEKVVECVMLFAYQRFSAFPVDVWIGRVMRRRYFPRRRKVTDAQIREFARAHFGPLCGWAQQYIYCLAREGGSRISLEATVPSEPIS